MANGKRANSLQLRTLWQAHVVERLANLVLPGRTPKTVEKPILGHSCMLAGYDKVNKRSFQLCNLGYRIIIIILWIALVEHESYFRAMHRLVVRQE